MKLFVKLLSFLLFIPFTLFPKHSKYSGNNVVTENGAHRFINTFDHDNWVYRLNSTNIKGEKPLVKYNLVLICIENILEKTIS